MLLCDADYLSSTLILPFQSIDGGTKAKKAFVLDPKLLGPLGLLIEPDFLKVRASLHLPTPLPPESPNIPYVSSLGSRNGKALRSVSHSH